jgi:hypothetical protein
LFACKAEEERCLAWERSEEEFARKQNLAVAYSKSAPTRPPAISDSFQALEDALPVPPRSWLPALEDSLTTGPIRASSIRPFRSCPWQAS